MVFKKFTNRIKTSWRPANIFRALEPICSKQIKPLNSIHPNIRLADFYEHKNTHISLCKCGLCADVLRRPVTISECEYIICFSCFAKYIKSKLESESFCPTWYINFKIDIIKFSQHQKKKKKWKKKILDSRIKVKKNTGLKYHVIYVLKNLV